MNREKITRLAKLAATKVVDYDLIGNPITDADVVMLGAYGPFIERFYAIAFEAGRQAEREEIMKDLLPPITAPQTKAHYIANEIAYALCNLIRARGDSK